MIYDIFLSIRNYFIFLLALLIGITFIVFPMALDLIFIKTYLLIILVMYAILKSFYGKFLIASDLFIASFFLITTGLFYTFYGLLEASPGWSKQGQLLVFWPIIFTFLIPMFSTKNSWKLVNINLFISSILIFIFSIYLIFIELNIINDLGLKNLLPNLKTGISLNESGIELGWPGFNSLPFLIPFVLCYSVLRNNFSNEFRINNIIVLLALLSILVVSVISGRRALLLILFSSFLTLLFFSYFLPSNKFKNALKNLLIFVSIPIPLVIFILIYFQIDLFLVYENFVEGFQFNDLSNVSANRRTIQLNALINGWSEVPLIGAGLGSHVDYIRSWDMPWSYELFYLAFLYQVGFLGFLIYSLGILWIVMESIKIIRLGNNNSFQIICLLCGMFGALIASITNPYLLRFDGLWVIFIPAAFINYHFIKFQNENHNL